MTDKELTSIEFLEKVKRVAMAQMDLAVPYDRPDLFTTKRFVVGMIYALASEGIVLTKLEKNNGTK